MELLKLTEKEQNKILEEFQIKENEVQEIIKSIIIWKEKQPHLPELSDEMIRRLLIYNKFRIERTKEKIDNYFTLRGQNRDLLTGLEEISVLKHTTCVLSMPQVTPKVQRIVIIKLLDPNPDHYDFEKVVKLGLASIEINLQYDDSTGVCFILDYESFSFKHFLSLSLPLFYKVYNLLEKAYSLRIFGITIVNLPDFGNKLLSMFKLFLPEKIYQRINILNDCSQLPELYPKECLPAEYGGTCSNFKDLLLKWDQVFKNHHDFFLKTVENVSNEDLRSAQSKASDMYGPEGSFKKLSLD